MTPAIKKLSLKSVEMKEYLFILNFIVLVLYVKNKPGKQWGQKHLAFLMATLENSALFHALLKVLFKHSSKKVLFYLPCWDDTKNEGREKFWKNYAIFRNNTEKEYFDT